MPDALGLMPVSGYDARSTLVTDGVSSASTVSWAVSCCDESRRVISEVV